VTKTGTPSARAVRVDGARGEPLTGVFLDQDANEILALNGGVGLTVGPLSANDLAVFGLACLRQAMTMDAAAGDATAAAAAVQLDRIASAFKPGIMN
jgi:hypothetical protein